MKIIKYEEQSFEEMLTRKSENADVENVVSSIINDVKTRGDAALFEYAEKFDGAKLSSLVVSDQEIDNALKEIFGTKLQQALGVAFHNIKNFHSRQKREGFACYGNNPYGDDKIMGAGTVVGQRILPLKKVGIYIPGGTASYSSSVLMNAIPAKVAGVDEIYMVTPPDKNGNIKTAVLAAAYMCGVKTIFKIGGAGAVAALTYGTETIPKVDKITGPGNIYVATAKKQVYGTVDIDMIAGPSDILVVADDFANPRYVAADLLSQAEHDVMASSVLVTSSEKIAKETAEEITKQLKDLPRKEIAETSIENNGLIIITKDIETAVKISNEIAPEHLELCVEEPFALLGSVENAGSVFLGHMSPEAVGDYIAGPNHTLPTEGTARFSSPLCVDDFTKKTSYIHYTKEALSAVKEEIETFAKDEGLDAHANSVTIRFE